MKRPVMITGVALLVATLASVQPSVQAQEEEKELGWSHKADFSWVLTNGNSEISTLGLNYAGKRTWERALFQIKTGGLRAENTTKFYVEPSPGASVVEKDETETTAENYYLTARYDRNISERFFWYAAAGWLRNEFAGIENRYTASAGVGNVWFDNDERTFRTNYGVSYTDQEDVFPEGFSDSWAGLLVGWNYSNKFGKNTQYANDFIFNYSLDESSDWRWVMDQWVAVSMSEALALKVTLTWLYDNLPALGTFELRDPAGNVIGTTVQPLDELDTIFGVSLVVNF